MLGEADQFIEARLRKLEGVRALGIDPFPRRFDRTHLSREVVASFAQLEGTAVRVAGRLVGGVRDLGGSAFVHLLDGAGRIQVYLRRDVLGDQGFALYRLLDAGDFIGVEGRLFRTKAGEITIEAHALTFLSKALRPLPEKWHGLTDVEKRYRQRYLELITSEESREIFALRSRTISAIRRFLDSRGFTEVETPVLQPVASGAAAKPFETFSNALDTTLSLRIALELHLKRCIIGGMERVYEIGRIFRNEGLSVKHNPEFTMLELYQAYADYTDIMALVEALVAFTCEEVLGSTVVRWGEETIDVAPPWPRWSLRDLLMEHTGVDYRAHPDDETLRAAARQAGLELQPGWSRAKIIDELTSTFVEPRLMQPCFVVDYPVETTPLAKRRPDHPDEVERFEGFVAGMEIADAFSELNDPLEQRERFEEQARQRALGDEEAQALDEDFLEAMEHGMPPTGGLGLGIDRLVMVLANRPSIREVILFPQLRSRGAR